MIHHQFSSSDNADDRVHLADVREKLIAQPLRAPRTRPAMSTISR